MLRQRILINTVICNAITILPINLYCTCWGKASLRYTREAMPPFRQTTNPSHAKRWEQAPATIPLHRRGAFPLHPMSSGTSGSPQRPRRDRQSSPRRNRRDSQTPRPIRRPELRPRPCRWSRQSSERPLPFQMQSHPQ